MAKGTERTGNTIEPDLNTYVITLVLSDLKKSTALAIEDEIRELVEGPKFTGDFDGAFMLTSHAKLAYYSDRQPLGKSIRLTG